MKAILAEVNEDDVLYVAAEILADLSADDFVDFLGEMERNHTVYWERIAGVLVERRRLRLSKDGYSATVADYLVNSILRLSEDK